MAESQSLINAPEYANVIDQLTKRYALQKSQADASAKGEAQRRGLVNQTGTSDIEASLRGNAVGNVANAESDAISNVMLQAAQQGNANQQAALNRSFQTSERLGGQGFQSGENLANRGWQTGENLANRGWQTGEREAGQTWQGGQAGLQRDWQGNQQLQNQGWQAGQNTLDRSLTQQQINMQNNQNDYRPSNWQSFLGGIMPGVGSGVGQGIVGGIKKLFSDIRLKQNIKPIATLYEFEYKDNDVTSKLGINDGKKHIGFMAQEIEKVMPEAVSEQDGYKMVDYSKVIGV